MHAHTCCQHPFVQVTQLCLTLCNLMDYTVHGILQATILEWGAFPFSRGPSQLRNWTLVSALQADSLPAEPQGSPLRLLSWSHCSRIEAFGLRYKVSNRILKVSIILHRWRKHVILGLFAMYPTSAARENIFDDRITVFWPFGASYLGHPNLFKNIPSSSGAQSLKEICLRRVPLCKLLQTHLWAIHAPSLTVLFPSSTVSSGTSPSWPLQVVVRAVLPWLSVACFCFLAVTISRDWCPAKDVFPPGWSPHTRFRQSSI